MSSTWMRWSAEIEETEDLTMANFPLRTAMR